MTCELAVIIPTFNERGNVAPMVAALEKALEGIAWEVIFVDDHSPDGTAEAVRAFADGPRVRCVERIGRRGLSSACIEGMLATNAPYIAVVDADLQHDETRLPAMLEILKGSDIELVSGSRYMPEGSTGDLPSARVAISGFATRVSNKLTKTELTDPMSGFFMLKRTFLDRAVQNLSGKGFKILLDLFLSVDGEVAYREVPYRMRSRQFGESKLDTLVILEFAILLFDKMVGWLVPVQFVLFVLVGLLGATVHIGVLGLLHKTMGVEFLPAQIGATLIAMSLNYSVNNFFTYRDRRQHGLRFWTGMAKFYVACAIGALINFQLADFLFDLAVPWWLAGLLGAVVGAVWNYAISSTLIWNRSWQKKKS